MARRRRLARILAAVVGIAVAAGAGLWFFGRGTVEGPAAAARKIPVAERAAATAPPLPTLVPVEVPPPAEAVARPRPTHTAVASAGTSAAAAPPSAAPNPPAPRSQALTDGKTYAGSVVPPGGAKVELGGIVWSEAEPRALLNDRIVGVGAWVEGFTVSKIEPERVALEKDGLTIYLTLK